MAQDASHALAEILEKSQSLQMATLDENGMPAISYAPFVRDHLGDFYIFISGLASHTQDLQRQPRVAILLMADEQATRQIFARTRVTYQCQASVVPREAPEYNAMLDALQARFGEVVGVLRGLADFILFRLSPQSGRFVVGFGQAFTLSGAGLQTLEHITKV